MFTLHLSRKAHGKHFPSLSAEKMGMTHDIDLKGTQKEQDVMTPTRLSLILGIQTGTMYKAFKIVGTGTWGVNLPLSVADIDALILYYAGLGNETAIKLAESRQKPTETENKAPEKEVVSSAPATETEKEREETGRKVSRWYYLADTIFFFVLIMTGAEIWFFLSAGTKAEATGYNIIKVWGIGLWFVYAVATTISLVMAKDANIPKTAEWGFTALVILEIFGAVCHFSMAKYLVTEAAKNGLMPFTYAFPSQAMEGEWYSVTAPLWIAGAIAGILSGIVIYAVWIRLNITKELSR